MRNLIVIISLLFYPLLALAHPSAKLLENYEGVYALLAQKAVSPTSPTHLKLHSLVKKVRQLQPDVPVGGLLVLNDKDGIVGQAFPSGAIVLNSELVNETEAVQLFIVAHELAHVRQNIFGSFTRFLNERIPAKTQDAELVPLLMEVTDDFMALSRKHEHDADAFAAALVRRAGYPLDDIIKFFQKMPEGALMTHPSHKDRIKHIESFQ